MSKYTCPRCGNNKEFMAAALIYEDWIIDGNGDFLRLDMDQSGEIFRPAQESEDFTCVGCGYSAERKEFEQD